MLKEQLLRLATETNHPCLTISLNTHRTHPDSARDIIQLKNLCQEAEGRLVEEFGKRPIESLLEKLAKIPLEIDVNYNLDSLHIFLSNETQEIVRSIWPVKEDAVHIDQRFVIRPLIKAYNRSESYLILALSQDGVHLYETLNNEIVGEIRNEDFPFKSTTYYHTDPQKMSEPKAVDNMVRQFLNEVDKAVLREHIQSGLNCIVISTGDNYSRLLQVADRPTVYTGHAPINYNQTALHHLADQAWEIVQTLQDGRRSEAIQEMKEAVSQGKVLTDLQEIYRAAKEGRGELLITHQDFSQPVMMKDEFSFELVQDATQPHAIDDISSHIAWEVISKKGKAIFTDKEEIKELGDIALKVRY